MIENDNDTLCMPQRTGRLQVRLNVYETESLWTIMRMKYLGKHKKIEQRKSHSI